MEKKTRLTIVGIAAAIIIFVIIIASLMIKKMTPSNEVMPLTDYYRLEESQVLVILQDEIYEKKGLLHNGMVYIDYDTVKKVFNHRFYYDSNEEILTFTTPEEILRSKEGENEYTVTKNMIETKMASDYPFVKQQGDQVYLSLDFVQKYSDLTFEYYNNPNRVVINYRWDSYLYTEVAKQTQLRYEASIKSPILLELPVGTSLMYVDTEEAPKKGFIKVMTADGIKGHVREKHVKKAAYKKLESMFAEPVYTAQTRPGKINMVFHQVLNPDANNYLDDLISSTKDVTVIAPTWFSVLDESGSLNSLASEDYVNYAADLGIEVWAAVDDFNFNPKIDMSKLLSHTSSRDVLSNSLIDLALQYKLNGINIDFERISSATGEHYIQFLRELSVKCRNNGIVLSVDNYVPEPYNAHYNWEEQGVVVDYVVIMAYDEHHAGSEVAGPVSSISFVEKAIDNILEIVPKEKTVIAIPFYTRLWKETEEGVVSSSNVYMYEVESFLSENNLEAKWDDAYGGYYAEYTQEGAVYRIWLEEEKSIEEKLKVIEAADVAGVAEWKLGYETQEIWELISKYNRE